MHTLPSEINFFERGWLSSNNVLIHDEDSAILIDTGYWTHASQTLALVQSVLKDKPLTAVLNTHLHSDHCGGNSYLQANFPNVQIHIPPGHAQFVKEWDAAKLTYSPTGQHCPKFSHSRLLNGGDTFTIASKTWQVYTAPGHDPHSVVIFNEDDRILVSADALWENGFGVVFPEIEGLSAFDEVSLTLDVIEDLNPKLVLPGHGPAFSDIDGALRRARSRLAQFRATPDKHASYAAKVLLKFKLLEFQKVKLAKFLMWAESTSYLKLLHQEYATEKTFDAWIIELCNGMQKSSACRISQDEITNID